MSNNKNLRIIKWSLPLIVVSVVCLLAFKPSAQHIPFSRLYFKYQPTTDFSSGSVSANANWQQVSEEDVCEQETDDVACSFSIYVPTEDMDNYISASNNPSSRLTIQVSGTGNDYFVDDILDNNASIQHEVQNVERLQ